ncbi:MAG: arsenate reductase family protein [Bdellovibrionaceae bacterium]|nr:arsenate reductase family protein [Pseudobdellovibrionaceae bacterium]MBX3035196.1 arsenate reductase family protein [Pseudobdellovibrionaceae bacterium]
MKVYEYPKCSTCVKALKFLDRKKVGYDRVDITVNPPSKAELKKMLKVYEGDLKRLFNTSGVQYRELKIADRLKGMSEDEALDLLAGNGRLVKRPFVLTGASGVVGFKEDEWKRLF